ncbi:hypothetical protein ACFXG4_37590 [Nocardia sp. NPDC059246]|uniref:hypothetical protein n=1 Tax=unclassified Nocardia TaxID=2637762 RepID=UPI0036849617
MKIRNLAATAAFAASIVTVSAGTVYADPAPGAAPSVSAQQDAPAAINWDARVVDKSIVIKTDLGSLAERDGQFLVLDPNGTVMAGLPLSYFRDGKKFPIVAQIDNNTATLTPSADPATAQPADMPINPVDAQTDAAVDAALANAGGKFALAVGVGTLIGSIIGLVGGCVLGAVTVGALTAPIFFAGALGGCISGAGAGAALGAAIGAIALGVPVGIAAAIQFFQAINAPAPAAATPAPTN